MSSDDHDDHLYVTGSDVKNFIFCERVVYFNRVMHIEPMLMSQQFNAKLEHKTEERNEMRRKGIRAYKDMEICDPSSSTTVQEYGLPKHPNYKVVSQRLMATAIIDCVLEDRYGRLIPVEYKSMRSNNGRAYSDHIYQIAFYALLLEDSLKRVSNEGYIHYNDIVVRIKITDGMKRHVKRIISRINNIIMEERLPPIKVNKRKCNGGCGYRYVCYGY